MPISFGLGRGQIFSKGQAVSDSSMILNLDAGNSASYSGSGTTWFDLSGNNKNATLFGSPSYLAANSGTFQFDNTDDYATLSLSLPGTYTFETWIYHTPSGAAGDFGHVANGNSGTIRPLLALAEGSGAGLVAGDFYITTPDNTGVTSMNYRLTPNVWNHVVAVWRTNQVLLYVDGILRSTTTTGYTPPNSILNIGRFSSNPSFPHYFNGRIGSIKIYNKELTANEISQKYDDTKSRFDGSMILEINTANSAGTTYDLNFFTPAGGVSPNYTVDWGDGTVQNFTTVGTKSRTYSAGGTYQIKISGAVGGIGWNTDTTTRTNNQKLTKIIDWGTITGLTSLAGFANQSRLTAIPNKLPSSITDLSFMFYLASTFNLNISGWNTSNVTSLRSTFASASAFNQNIGSWDVSKVTTLESTFANATAFNNGGSNTINNWNTGLVTTMNSTFYQAYGFNQPIGNWNTANVTVMLFTFGGGSFGMTFNQNIGAWNVSKVTTFQQMFQNNANFNNGGSDSIKNWSINTNASQTVNMSQMFRSATSFNQPIGSWNMSRVHNIFHMFSGCTAFNQPLNTWNITTLVTSLSNTFSGATAFNQNIGSWNVSAVSDFSGTFNGASAFNNGGSSDINNWTLNSNASANIIMNNMFQNCVAFNQPLGNWNTSRVSAAGSLFDGASTFNQDLSNWNVSNLTNMGNMFRGTTAFNNGGSPNINNWTLNTNASASVTMLSMFQNAAAFNQPIGNWNTTRVTSMNSTFNGAVLFNQDINSWIVTNCTDFSNTFSGATAFNRSLSNWTFPAEKTSLVNMFNNCGMNSENYSRTLIGWANAAASSGNDFYMKGLYLGASGRKYNSTNYGGTPYNTGSAARAYLLNRDTAVSTSNFNSVCMSADGTFIAYADLAGYIMTSSNGGTTWTARLTDATRTWRGLACSSDGSKLVAAAQNGKIYTSTDSGATWTERESNRSWICVASSSDGTVLGAVVDGGVIYTSSDSGATWTARETGSNRSYRSIAVSPDGTKMTAVVWQGGLYQSSNGGVTWAVNSGASGGGTRQWLKVIYSGDGSKLITTVYGNNMRISADNGATWTATAQSGLFAGICSNSDGSKLVAANMDVFAGTLYTSTNGGTTFTQRASSLGTNMSWTGVACSSDGSKIIAVRQYSGTNNIQAASPYISTDSGVTWTRIQKSDAQGANWNIISDSAE